MLWGTNREWSLCHPASSVGLSEALMSDLVLVGLVLESSHILLSNLTVWALVLAKYQWASVSVSRSHISWPPHFQPSGLGLLFGWLDLVLIFGLHPTDVHGYSCICTKGSFPIKLEGPVRFWGSNPGQP